MIATPTVTVEVQCFGTGDGKGMCTVHTKFKCRRWHCDLPLEDFGGDNLRPSGFMIAMRRGRVVYPGGFANDWRALQWQPTVWVHWTCIHSGWFAAEYRNFYIFSSIPTERRNVEFKMDMRHLYMFYNNIAPIFHMLELDAFEVGLRTWHGLHGTKDKKRRIGRRNT